jgi:hypothetical protein
MDGAAGRARDIEDLVRSLRCRQRSWFDLAGEGMIVCSLEQF